MKVGMLWFDGDRRTELAHRVQRAATYYREKYGSVPNVCVVHPSTAGPSAPADVGGLRLVTSPSVLPDHFWLGIDQRGEAVGRALAS